MPSLKKFRPSAQFLGLAAIFISLTGFAISGNAIPPLITTISKEIGSSFESFGYVIMLQFLSFTVAAFVGGWLGEKHGARPATLVMTGLCIVTLCFFIGPLFRGILFFVFWSIPLGFGGGLIETFASILVSRYDRPGSSRLMNLSQSFFTLGAVIAPQTVSFALVAGVHWRVIFIIFALFMASVAVFFFFFFRDSSVNTVLHPARQTPGKEDSLWTLLKNPWFLLFAFSMFINVTIESTMASWLPAYFEIHLGVSAASAAWRMSVLWGGVMVGRLMMMVLPDRWSFAPAMITGGAGMTVSLFFLSIAELPWLATVFVASAGVLYGPVWPATVSTCENRFQNQRFTSGIIGVGALGVSVGPFVASLIIKHIGFKTLFPVFTVVAALLTTLYVYIAGLMRKSATPGTAAPQK
jgi:MFS transporter, FHS family, glucose/mannose:H+ symporter